MHAKQHCDGKRKRRHSSNRAKREWYALHRAHRFVRRFGWEHEHDAVCTAVRALRR